MRSSSADNIEDSVSQRHALHVSSASRFILHETRLHVYPQDRFVPHWCVGRQAMTLEIQSAVASTFAEHLNGTFRLHHQPATTELELLEVSDRSADRHINFTLLFRGPLQPLLPQQIYPVEHDRLGRFDLFIVPVRRG